MNFLVYLLNEVRRIESIRPFLVSPLSTSPLSGIRPFMVFAPLWHSPLYGIRPFLVRPFLVRPFQIRPFQIRLFQSAPLKMADG